MQVLWLLLQLESAHVSLSLHVDYSSAQYQHVLAAWLANVLHP